MTEHNTEEDELTVGEEAKLPPPEVLSKIKQNQQQKTKRRKRLRNHISIGEDCSDGVDLTPFFHRLEGFNLQKDSDELYKMSLRYSEAGNLCLERKLRRRIRSVSGILTEAVREIECIRRWIQY